MQFTPMLGYLLIVPFHLLVTFSLSAGFWKVLKSNFTKISTCWLLLDYLIKKKLHKDHHPGTGEKESINYASKIQITHHKISPMRTDTEGCRGKLSTECTAKLPLLTPRACALIE